MSSFSDLKDLISSLASSDAAGMWRVFIALLLVGHIAWACGWLPGISGFAFANDVDALRSEFNEYLKVDLEEKLFNMQERLCALRAGDKNVHVPDREYRFKERIRVLLNAYRDLISRSYVLDECARL